MSTNATRQKTEAPMNVSARQEVRDRGWTPDALRRAIAALGDLVAERPVGSEDRDLAGELVRLLLCASEHDSELLVECLQPYRPLSPNAPQWDELYAVLDGECEITGLIIRLKERYPDPVQTLIALLDDVLPDNTAVDAGTLEHEKAVDLQMRAFDAQQRAFAALVALGTRESLTYVLSRLELFDWFDEHVVDEVVRPHGPMIKVTALAVWPTLGWRGRSAVAAFLSAHSLVDDDVLHFVMAPRPEGVENIDGYLKTLGNFYDPRVLPQIEAIIVCVHETLDTYGKQAAQQLVRTAIRQFIKLEMRPVADLRRRADACGVHWEDELAVLDRSQRAVSERREQGQP
jgi:hypothetical protein